VQLAGLKRRELAALCRARGLPTALEDGDGVPRRLETGQLLALLR
jgi:seryl-tRNA(Sec) selenium transferase